MTKEYVEERYNLLFELYGVQSRGWSMLHEQFNRYVMGIDNFLKEYKNAVYSCLTNLQ